MEIYLDNAATTRVSDSVCQLMMQVMTEHYGNPSSLHHKGVEAEQYIKKSKEILARILKVDPKEIIFTSGGTESNNMALIGAAMANRRQGMHILTSVIEHAAVYKPLEYLAEQGFEIGYIPVDSRGRIDLEALKAVIRPDTILVTLIGVNNEIGSVQPLKEIGQVIKSVNPATLFHVDAIQAFGKMQLLPGRWKIDLLSVSAHKFHGPKGIGMLYVRDRVKIKPIMLGGGQQKSMRSGTENVPGAAGLGQAAAEAYENLEAKRKALFTLRNDFIDQLQTIDNVFINGTGKADLDMLEDAETAPHIVSVSFGDIRAEVLLHALEDYHIYVSSGSACSSNHPALSSTLQAIGTAKQYLDATIRFSFSYHTTKEEIDQCVQCLKQLVPVLRRYTPGGRK